MNQEFYQYIQKMHLFIQAQDEKIRKLEKTIEALVKDVKQLKEKPALRVDKIEYKFDQLKVETLEGTLNIGLNPNDLQGIEEFSVDNQQVKTGFAPKDVMQTARTLEDEMYRYLETGIDPIINEAQKQLNMKVDESYIAFIKDDIKKQIPVRIEFYMKQNPPTAREDTQLAEWKNGILVQLKQEIENGVLVFLKNLPENVKGMMKNDFPGSQS